MKRWLVILFVIGSACFLVLAGNFIAAMWAFFYLYAACRVWDLESENRNR